MTEREEKLKILIPKILSWYRENKRDLPWRKDKNPYHIWLSEIMLQQTRVEAVRGYYLRFLDVLPTVESLASCPEERLYKLWEGLGYYSRVRNLQKAAKTVMETYHGIFPQRYEDVIALSGIGEYTAGAICSIAFNLPTPAVDGNVLRVTSRLFADETPIDLPKVKQSVRTELATVYPAEAGELTQALMELGATVCGPNRKPECKLCPCRDACEGNQQGIAENFPKKLPKRPRKTEEKTVFILNCDGYLALEKRPKTGLLAGMWQFPNVETKLETAEAIAVAEGWNVHPKHILQQIEREHIFTHIVWNMRGIYLEVQEKSSQFVWLSEEEIRADAALPTAFRQFLLQKDVATSETNPNMLTFFQKTV